MNSILNSQRWWDPAPLQPVYTLPTTRQRVGFTCSAFDLLHAGHIAMLQEAKSQCDYLIVGLQSDPSLDRAEKNQPVQSIVERQQQLRGCKYVDEIWVYDTERDLEDLLAVLPITIRILGEEYKGRDFTGYQICKKRGIQFYYNRRLHDWSSSELRQRIQEQQQ